PQQYLPGAPRQSRARQRRDSWRGPVGRAVRFRVRGTWCVTSYNLTLRLDYNIERARPSIHLWAEKGPFGTAAPCSSPHRREYTRTEGLPTRSNRMFKIGDFARISGISVKTLRYYDAVGLLPAAVVDRFTGYRYYSIGQLPRLNRILALKDLGFPL